MADFKAALSGFAGGAITDWAIQRAARQWGIFLPYEDKPPSPFARVLGDDIDSLLSRKPKNILSAAHVESLDLTRQTTVSTAPQEDGAFMAYDKVQAPYTATIRFVCDGSETGSIAENLLPGFVRGLLGDGPDSIRRDFIPTLETLVTDTKLYFIATPERIYKRANVIGYRFTRNISTTGLIAADVTVQEIRSAKTSGWVNTKHPQGAQKESGGYVQAGAN